MSTAWGPTGTSTVRELRRTRQRRRLGDVEWFDVAYRVYLTALAGLIATVLVSDAVRGLIGDDVTTEEVLRRGPAALGVAVSVAALWGLRSGTDGGPVSIERADVQHLLTAPVSRRAVMSRPITQRLRAVAFGLAVACAVVGQLVGRELDGSRAAWAASCALFGGTIGVVLITTAVIAHALAVPRWVATLVGGSLVGWQTVAAWSAWSDDDPARQGPADLLGSVALWGIRQRWPDVAALAVVCMLAATALLLGGRLRPEHLLRRGELVSQLRFAATMQDLRTVVLLRRQLRAEHPRGVPWGLRSPHRTKNRRPRTSKAKGSSALAVWRRGVASLRRLPAPRLGRITALAVAAGAGATLSVTSTPLFALGLVAALFVLGLEAIEPLSQEIDHPGRTELLPVDRGWLYLHHLLAPALLLTGAGAVAVVTTVLIEPDALPYAVTLALPVAWAGATGAVVATVRDAPRTGHGRADAASSPFTPPEFAGFATATKTAFPVLVSAVAALPVLALRAAPTAATVVRGSIGLGLLIAAVAWWVRRRDTWSTRVHEFLDAGRAATGATP